MKTTIQKNHTQEHMKKMRIEKAIKQEAKKLREKLSEIPTEHRELEKKVGKYTMDYPAEYKKDSKSPISKQQNRIQTLLIWIIGIISISPMIVSGEYMMIKSVMDNNPIGYVLSCSILIAIGIFFFLFVAPFIKTKK